MLFNSTEFFIFLAVVFPAYFVSRRLGPRGSVVILLIASLFFYAWWSLQYLWLLLLSICFNGVIGTQLRRTELSKQNRNLLLAFGITVDFAVLFVFKYLDFFLRDVPASEPVGIALPLGISFYTFTQIAYLVDARRNDVAADTPLSYGVFVSYFPHLIAGPIIHHKQVMPQLVDPANHVIRRDMVSVGLTLLVIGLIKKLYLADNVEAYVQPIFSLAAAGGDPSLLDAWGGAIAYTLQLYFDFSGYSDMAVGISMLFGIRLPINFDSPYKADSIIDFWRRWHMTLSAFLRDYLYIPLGGNRKGPLRRYVNLMVTMCLGGLWHGANWTFLVWGALHGIYLMINHLARALRPPAPGIAHHLMGRGLTLLAVIIAWVFFRADNLGAARHVLAGMVGWNGVGIPAGFNVTEMTWLAALLFLTQIAPSSNQIADRLHALVLKPDARWRRVVVALSGGACGAALAYILATTLLATNATEFLYFNF